MDGFAEVYSRQYAKLVRLARQLVDDRESAEEAVQEVFARLHAQRRMPTLSEAYLRTAVVNQCRSTLRRRRLSRNLVEPSERPAAWIDLGDRLAERDVIQRAMRRLPARQREVLVLRYFEDLSFREIAVVLNTSVGAASAAHGRAMELIRNYVESGPYE